MKSLKKLKFLDLFPKTAEEVKQLSPLGAVGKNCTIKSFITQLIILSISNWSFYINLAASFRAQRVFESRSVSLCEINQLNVETNRHNTFSACICW